MQDASHPLWSIARLAVLMIGLLGVLWMNANKFDHTEIKSLVEYFLIAASIEGGVSGARALMKPKEK